MAGEMFLDAEEQRFALALRRLRFARGFGRFLEVALSPIFLERHTDNLRETLGV
jgi:hypothetical protein